MLARAFIAAALGLALTGCGVTGNYRNDPGYADFRSLGRIDAESDFALSLGPLPLKLAGFFIDDDELGPLLEELRAVRVYTFEGVRDADTADGVKSLVRGMVDEGWLSVVTVREEAETTSVIVRPGANGKTRGLALIVQEPEEVVLVNLIGNVRLDLLNGYMAELDVETPWLTVDEGALQAALSPVQNGRHDE